MTITFADRISSVKDPASAGGTAIGSFEELAIVRVGVADELEKAGGANLTPLFRETKPAYPEYADQSGSILGWNLPKESAESLRKAVKNLTPAQVSAFLPAAQRLDRQLAALDATEDPKQRLLPENVQYLKAMVHELSSALYARDTAERGAQVDAIQSKIIADDLKQHPDFQVRPGAGLTAPVLSGGMAAMSASAAAAAAVAKIKR